MPTSFPGAVDTLTNPSASDYTNSVSVPHHTQHTNLNDALEAVQTSVLGLRLDLAAAKLVGGATSFSIRNKADSANNLIITDAGNATLRGTLAMSQAVSQVIPGVTSFAIRNNANTADNYSLLDNGQSTTTVNLTGAPVLIGGMHQAIVNFSNLSADYTGIINAFQADITTDTSAFNYNAPGTGALRGVLAHVFIQSVGATVAEGCALDGIVAPLTNATGTLTLGFGCVGQIQNVDSALNVTTFTGVAGVAVQAGTGTYFQANGISGTVQTTLGKAGNITHGYGADILAAHNSASTYTEAIGTRSRVTLNNAAILASSPIAVEAFVQSSGTASVTNNSSFGVRGRVLWGSTSNLTSAFGVAGSVSVTAASTVSQITALRADAPTVSGGGSASIAFGVRIADQSGAGIGTSFALNIDNQVTAGAVSIRTLGGLHQFGATANVGAAFVISDLTTNLYTVDTRTTVANLFAHKFVGPVTTVVAAAGLTYSVVSIPAYTYGTTGTTTVTAINGLSLNIAAPTISAAGNSTTQIASTVYISGAPIPAGAGPALITKSFALHVADGLSFFGGAIIASHAPTAINSTGTATAVQAATGYITSTSAAPTTITLPTGTTLGAVLGAVQGTIHYLTVDNTAGASTVTVAVNTNAILSADAVANAGSAGLLTIPSGVTGQGTFMLMFSSATAYTFSRIA